MRQSTLYREKVPRRASQHLNEVSPPLDSTPAQTLKEVLLDIDEINIAKSFISHKLKEPQLTNVSSKSNSHHSSEGIMEVDQKDHHPSTLQKDYKKPENKKSLIFSPTLFNKNKEFKKCNEQHTIKIYYFNLPTCKTFKYDVNTTISYLIMESLNAYLEDSRLDSSKIKTKNYQNYELRMLLDENSFKADMSIQPISYDRLVCDNIFDSLVLLIKDDQKKRKMSSKSQTLQFFRTSTKKNSTLIHIFNQLGQELGVLHMQRTDSLEKIFDYVQTNDFHNMRSYYLSQNISDDHGLPRDFQIKNLQSNTIYIKAKKYIDESEFQSKTTRPIRGLTISLTHQRTSVIPLPIGLKEASQYEEFKVIKINSMGFQQERILGIDQTKIYNYDRELREERKKAGFFSKLFGNNETTGTKKPFRLIEDLLDVKECQNGFILVFKEKSIQFLLCNQEKVERIIRKLKFLISHSRQQQSRMSRCEY